ncbi:MAG: transposase [Acidimicrobiales bacterium]
MAYNFLAVERAQVYLLPPSVADWLPEDHLAWFVLDTVDEVDLAPFYAGYRTDSWGAAAHDPKMMLALTLYAYCLGVRSSRQIERACHVDVGFKVVAANQCPDHATIARFRQRHQEAMSSVFTSPLRLCAQAGMVSLGVVAVDGTKMRCPAALDANRTKDHIEAVVQQMFEDTAAQDVAEDAALGPDATGDEPPAQLRGKAARRERLAAAKAELEAQDRAAKEAHEAHLAERAEKEQASGKRLRRRQPKAPDTSEAKANISDPESRIMKTKDGYIQGTKRPGRGQRGAGRRGGRGDRRAQRHGAAPPMIEATNRPLDDAGITERPTRLLADAGYASKDNLARLDESDPDCFIATRNMNKNPEPRNGSRGPLRSDANLVEKMDRKVLTDSGRAIYKKRQHIIEPVFGQTKDARGARRFIRRGKAAAQSEWKLLMGTHNLFKIYRRSLADATTARWSRMAVIA